MTVFEKIEAQQAGKENTAPWMVGEQLKDICRADPHCAEIVAQDLENKDMSLEACEKKIKAKADEIQKKSKQKCVCIPPNVAEQVIREFYGLPEAQAVAPVHDPAPVADTTGFLDLADLLG
jgi:hypothetical protein